MSNPSNKLLFKSPKGHEVYRYQNNIYIKYNQKMLAISTSQLNGGINEITYSFNHELSKWYQTIDDLPGGSIKAFMEHNSKKLGLDNTKTTGLITSASMDNVAIIYDSYRDVSLFAVITGGASKNAVRAGDRASYYEETNGEYKPITGTINIMLAIESRLPVESLARTSIIVTEAKTAALQDLQVQSSYSRGMATGTGTDGLIVACHTDDPLCFSDVGTHSKLGELISNVVKKGVTEALIKDGIEENSK